MVIGLSLFEDAEAAEAAEKVPKSLISGTYPK